MRRCGKYNYNGGRKKRAGAPPSFAGPTMSGPHSLRPMVPRLSIPLLSLPFPIAPFPLVPLPAIPLRQRLVPLVIGAALLLPAGSPHGRELVAQGSPEAPDPAVRLGNPTPAPRD